ncbi:hypothetical protein CsatB_030196 [Cannabis sativa]
MSSYPKITISSNSDQPIRTVHTNTLFARTILTRLRHHARHALSNRRLWTEFVDRTAFSRPATFSDAASRVRKNITYFRVNYVTLIAAVLAYFLISHPFSLLALIFLIGAWLFLYVLRPSDQPLEIYGRTYSDAQTLTGLVLTTLVAILITSVVSLLVSAVIVGVTIVCAHGAFRDPEDLFVDDQELVGFFSVINGGATSCGSAAAAGPMSVV